MSQSPLPRDPIEPEPALRRGEWIALAVIVLPIVAIVTIVALYAFNR